MKAVVFGNVTLDVICKTVDEVPRHESIAFEQVVVSPGGCGSNVAVGLSALEVPTALVACSGSDDAAQLVRQTWERAGLDLSYLRSIPGHSTGTSIGLVDSEAQPRFIHTSGANAHLTVDDLDLPAFSVKGARALHVAGFFVLPGILDGRLPQALEHAQQLGLSTTLDVVRSPRMKNPEPLWPCLPHLDVFLCNAHEAWMLTGESDPRAAAQALRRRGARAVIVKLGAEGCWLESVQNSETIPALQVEVVDTTGAGDAFAAGLVAATLRGEGLRSACRAGNAAGARIVGTLGAIRGWL